jgi:FkbM family methyltransferase
MIDRLRSLLRATGLNSRLSPLLAKLEDRRLAQYGRLVQRTASAQTSELISASGAAFRLGPPQHYADMAVSRHELPTLVACLNVFAPVIEGGVVWDVGGNAGFYSALISQLTGPSGRVYAFEPVPSTFENMCANLRAAGVENVSPLNLALSDRDGVLPISFDPSSDTTSSLEKTSGAACVEVRVAAGDSLVSSGECEPPVMLKMDIEGHELKALAGMKKLLARPECRAVLCEVHFSILAAGGEHQASARARGMLAEAGFDRLTFISRSHLMATKGRF